MFLSCSAGIFQEAAADSERAVLTGSDRGLAARPAVPRTWQHGDGESHFTPTCIQYPTFNLYV